VCWSTATSFTDDAVLSEGEIMSDSPDKDQQNTQGTPDGDVEADTASGGAPDLPDTTDEQGRPVDNPSGG
jgi:hypothetical protein